MSDNFDDDIDLEGDSFDTFEKKSPGTLSDLLRNNSVAKIGVVVAGVVVIFGIISFFGGKEATVAPSYVGGGSEITAPPGTEGATPAYVDAVKEENQARLETAIKEGSSALPTPIEPPVGRLVVPEEETVEEDPLQRWRKLQEERLQRELQRNQSLPQEAATIEDTGRAEAVQALSQAMSQQMQALLESRSTAKPIQAKNITNPSWLERLNQKEEAEAAAANAQNAAAEKIETILIPAGEIIYAQLITEANSDAPGPVLAQIAGGPLSGSRILGDFQVQEENETITLNFNKIVVDGKTLSIDAVALDPNTTLPGMATDVDHRYLRRIVLPMAAAFVEGLTSAISESGRTNVTVTGETVAEETEPADNKQQVSSGIEEAGQEFREILDEMNEDTKPLIRIEAGTPFGLLFLEPVVQSEDAPPQGN